MIVHHGHEVQELYRQGRKVKAVIRKGKRVFGIEGAEKIDIINFSAFNLFPDYCTNIKNILFTNIVSKNSINGEVIDITSPNSSIKTYLSLQMIDNKMTLVLMSKYFGQNTKFMLNGDCSSLFRRLMLESYDFIDNLNFDNVTNATMFFAESNIPIKNILNMPLCANYTNMFYYYYGPEIDCSLLRLYGNCNGMFWNSADKMTNIAELDTSNITNLRLFFYTNTKLYLNEIKNWNVEKVESIERIFARPGASSVKEVDMSGWRLLKCTNTTSVFDYYDKNNTCDIIKTPSVSAQLNIDLINTFYNADGSEYGNVIPANSVGSVTIYRTRELAREHNPELYES